MSQATTRRGPGRPRGSVAGQTKSDLVDIALIEFAESGYRGTSLAKVAQRAGLSQATVLHHFGTKAALLANVLRRRDEQDSRDVAGLVGASGWEAFEALLRLATVNAKRRSMVQLYVTMAGEAAVADHPATSWLCDHLDAIVGELTASLERGKQDGTVAPEAPSEAIARAFVATMDGLQLQWLTAGDVDMTQVLTECLAGLRARWAA